VLGDDVIRLDRIVNNQITIGREGLVAQRADTARFHPKALSRRGFLIVR
jgi:hypothetical protein